MIERLSAQFPELSRERIVRAVHGTYEGYNESAIRDFVPILVERSARERLASPAPRHRA